MVITMAASGSKFPRNVRAALRGLPREALSNFDPEVENLEPDRYGRFSLCIPVEQMSPDMEKEDIVAEFRPAANVTDVHKTDKYIFIRFDSKIELQNCYSNYKSKYDLRLGRKKRNESSKSNHRNEDEKPHSMPSRNQRQDQQSSYNGEGPRGDADQHRPRDRFSNKGMNRFDGRSHTSGNRHNVEDKEQSITELFASNIESEDDFERAMQTYRPKNVRVIVKDYTKFAFVSMWNHEDALAVIRDLDNKMQTNRRLSIKFNRQRHQSQTYSDHSSSKSESLSDVESPPSRGGPNSHQRHMPKENGQIDRSMPQLESVDFSDLPPLVRDEDVCDPDGRYDLDCCVVVTQFPPQTMESELRAVFKDFRVLDICVLNNGFPEGCTRAVLYMSTIYEAIQALTDKKGFMLHNHHLKVIPPLDNVILRKILLRLETGLREWN